MTPAQEALKADAIHGAAIVLAEARAARDAKSPRAAAEAAYYPGHPLGTVEAIEALIIRQRNDAAQQALSAPLPLAA
jgi:hypothetical protein